MNKNSSNSSDGAGNISSPKKSDKKQVSPSKRWCFTWNNYPDDWKSYFSADCITKYIIGEEIGEECGTPHLQGYIEFNPKKRPISVIKTDKIFWKKARGTAEENMDYCGKDSKTHLKGMRLKKPIKTLDMNSLYPWQKDIENIVTQEPDDRKIYWYHEEKGNTGKSAFSKYLVIKHDALVLSGKASDMKHGIVMYMNENQGVAPETIVLDLPRCFNKGFLSYQGIEEIKNGLFFSGKFESKMVVYNPPHLIIFSNEEPDTSKLSDDRWVIKDISVAA